MRQRDVPEESLQAGSREDASDQLDLLGLLGHERRHPGGGRVDGRRVELTAMGHDARTIGADVFEVRQEVECLGRQRRQHRRTR